ncbi:MAG TPA: 2-hydroxyacid dehydrogenase [Bdellovibrionota bacterium]|nr:2-hydroxyacid dehydrogenase [Bdellovibrionota bacterium]
MKVAIFSFHKFEKPFLVAANEMWRHEWTPFEAHLSASTVKLAEGYPAVSAFVSDCLSGEVIRALAAGGTRFVALRSAGFNHVDLAAARECGLRVTRVPAYSPYSVAEHTVAMMLALNRKLYKAYNRVREANFSLDGLLGFDMHGKTAGVIGTGKIGTIVVRILRAFGCRVLAYDTYPSEECRKLGAEYVSLPELYRASDIVTLHCPLNAETHHLLNEAAIAQMKHGVMIVNTGRGGLVDTRALIEGLKSGQVGHLGLDVYEEEENLFFEDYSASVVRDDVFMRLLTFPNVLITGHQGFFTDTALRNICETTLQNLADFEAGRELVNEVKV